MAELILTPSTSKGEMPRPAPCIGLSGPWGSGKSTVISLLEAECQRTSKDCVFWIFDAWSHEGDPLRRTFLESLIQKLLTARWLPSGATWEEELQILAKRRKVSERRNMPRLTSLPVALTLSLLFVPIGSAIFGAQIRGGLHVDTALSVDWIAVAGLALVLAPGLVLLCTAVVALLPANTPHWKRLQQALTTFVYRTEAESRTETLESGDQTSLEFEATFDRLMHAALDGRSERRLVLVIDNLDRIGASQALNVWSTLQTFLRRAEPTPVWRERLWCVLTFDAIAIRRLWEQVDSNSSMLAESFLDKTFQVRFEVPLPRFSLWKEYLSQLLAQALPRHAAQAPAIYRLYVTTRPADRWPSPTPRELTRFVNQLAALHRVWQHQIPLMDLAYFVLLRRDKKDDERLIVAELLKGLLPTASAAPLLSPGVRGSLEALSHGAPGDDGMEMQLREQILRALETPSPSRLCQLAQFSSFWDVLELAIDHKQQEWQTAENGRLLHAVLALTRADLARAEPAQHAAVLSRVTQIARRATQWIINDDAAVDGVLALARLEPGLADNLFRSFLELHTRDPEGLRSTKQLVRWYLKLVHGLKDADVPERSLYAPEGFEGFVTAARAMVRYDREGAYWRLLKPRAGVNLSELFQPARLAHWVNVARVTCSGGAEGALATQFVKAATDILQDGAADADRLVAAQGTLHVLSDHADAVAALAAFANSQRAFDLALREIPEDDPVSDSTHERLGVAAISLLSILKLRPWLLQSPTRSSDAHQLNVTISPEQWRALERWKQTWRPRTRALAAAARQFGHASILVAAARESAFGAVAADTLVELARLNSPRRVLPLDLLRGWHGAVPYERRFQVVWELARRDRALAAELSAAGFDPTLVFVYAAALSQLPGSDPRFLAFCREGFRAAPPSSWKELPDFQGASSALCRWLWQRDHRGEQHQFLATEFWRPLYELLTPEQRQTPLAQLAEQLLSERTSDSDLALHVVGTTSWDDFWRSLPPEAAQELLRRAISHPPLRLAAAWRLDTGLLAAPTGEARRALLAQLERARGHGDSDPWLAELRTAILRAAHA